jgi:ubiquinone/menaquinone biosynthesis C-methylase UbiE
MHTTHNQTIVEQFTQQAIPFTRVAGHSQQDALKSLVEVSGLTAQDTVLDVACGPGLVACEFAKHTKQVTGIDLTPAMIEQATQRQQAQGLSNINWQLGDVTQLPYADASFSMVITRFSFHHFVEPQMVLQEIWRVCEPCGTVMLVDVALPPEKVDTYNQMEKLRDPSHTRALTVQEFLNMAQQCGLQQLKIAEFKVEMELETQLKASFPNLGDEEKLRALFWEDLGKDNLGLGVHQRENCIHFAYPILIVVGKKP